MKHFMYKQNTFIFHRNILQKICILGITLKKLHCFTMQCSSIYFSSDKEALLKSLLHDLYTWNFIKYIKQLYTLYSVLETLYLQETGTVRQGLTIRINSLKQQTMLAYVMRKKCKVWLLLTACSDGRTCADSETVFRDPRQQLFQKSARTNFCPSQNPNRLD